MKCLMVKKDIYYGSVRSENGPETWKIYVMSLHFHARC